MSRISKFKDERASSPIVGFPLKPGEHSHGGLDSAPPMLSIMLDAIETAHQAAYDLCDEQRAFHLPRLNRIVLGLAMWFPKEFAHAMKEAKDGHGDLIAKG